MRTTPPPARRARAGMRAGAAVTVAALAALATACGGGSHDTAGHSTGTGASGAGRTVEITMVDTAYRPTDVTVSRGETVTFRFRNEGTAVHEAFLGDEAAQEGHHAQMQPGTTTAMEDGHGGDGRPGTSMAMAGMRAQEEAHEEAHGDDGHGGTSMAMDDGHGEAMTAVTVPAGGSADLTATFDEAGTLWIGCHEPGHWEAGMKLRVDVR